MNNKLTFNIKEVADMLGVVPATIRNWEKKGFFTPRRKENNYRYFTLDEIELLKQIKDLSIDKKMSTQAIKEIMTPTIEINKNILINRNNDVDDRLLSYKWKEKRDELGYTLENVSEKTGISTSYLSKIEKGQANLSIELLNKLASFYGESILYFVDRKPQNKRVIKDGEGELIDIGTNGIMIESLTNSNENLMFPVIYTLNPGFGSNEKHKHNGEEFLYILEGKLEVKLNDDEIYVLKKNDSIIFKSSDYHEWKNTSKKITKILWVHSPISKVTYSEKVSNDSLDFNND